MPQLLGMSSCIVVIEEAVAQVREIDLELHSVRVYHKEPLSLCTQLLQAGSFDAFELECLDFNFVPQQASFLAL